MSRFTDIRDQLAGIAGQLSARQKVAIALAATLTFGALIWIVTSASAPDYRTLYADLSEESAGQIVEQLEARQIPYRLQSPTSIAVPQEHLYQARLHLAGMGLPGGGEGRGYELFDEAEFGMTAFTQKVNYQRALEHELGQTIQAMRPIKRARVHLVLPERALFKDEQRQPSASVAVSLRPGQRLDPGQIQSIRYLVSSSVESLEPGRITIVDAAGELLARPDRGGGVADAHEALQASSKLEASLEERLVDLLAPIVGRENLRARVRAELDTSTSTRTDERYEPEQRAIRSEQRSERKEAVDGETVGGAPGVAANLAGAQGPAGVTREDLASSQTQETINYEVSRTVTQTSRQGYTIERLSVAVVLNEALLEAGDAGGAAREIDRERVEALVASAVGLRADRGDQVEITWESFAPVEAPSAEPVPVYMRPEVYVPALRYAFFALLALLLLVFVVRPLMRAVAGAARDEEADEAEQIEAVAEGEEVQIVGRTVAELEEELGEREVVDITIEAEDESSPYLQLREEIIALGSSDLDRTGDILRQWMRARDEAPQLEDDQKKEVA